MDRTSLIVIVACLVLLGLWSFVLVPKMYPPKALPPGATNAPARTAVGTNLPAAAPPILEAPSFARLSVNTNSPEELLEVTNANAHYTFTSHGGGLKLVELLHYPETVAGRGKQQNRVATLNTYTDPTLAVLGGEVVQGDGIFNLSRTPNGVRAEKALTNGLTIVKDFELSTNYLIFATVRFENRSTQTLSLPAQQWVVGTATPMNAQDDGSAEGLMWYNGDKPLDVPGKGFFKPTGIMCTPRVPPPEYRAGQSNIVWAVVHNQFFALAVMPKRAAWQVTMLPVELPRPSPQDISADSRINKQPTGYETFLLYPPLTLSTRQSMDEEFVIFAGPKEYRTLATVSATLKNDIDDIMGFSGSAWTSLFGFFSKALLLGMNWLHSTLRLGYGWAIVAITIIIKVVFWPLTQASTRSAKRMQALQPQIKALQEKYKDDPVKAQKKMMEFWKEHKVNPMSGCLPTLIQMPVFLGFFYMIRSAIELRGATFLWVRDLSRPDTLFLIPGVGFPFNLLPLIMGGTMLWQAHLTPPSPGMDPAQAKMMRYMPLMFMVFLYNFSAGLTLYWTVQNLLSIVQTKLTRTQPEPAAPVKGPVLTPPQKKKR